VGEGIDLSGAALKLQGLVIAATDLYREKVAERDAAQISVQKKHMQKHFDNKQSYEGAVQQDCEKLLSLARYCRQTALIFRRVCLGLAATYCSQGRVIDDSFLCLKKCTPHL
jgi:hypothetical protein